jgi:hypothetical protein
MHSDRTDNVTPPQELADERVPRRRLAAWSVAFAVIALGLVLYFIYSARVLPLID